MGFSHFGIAVMILGIGLVSSLESQKELIAFKEMPLNWKIIKSLTLEKKKRCSKFLIR